MDDLVSLEWPTMKNGHSQIPSNGTNLHNFPTLRPTPPLSGRGSPMLSSVSGQNGESERKASSSNDSFANLVSFAPSGNKPSLSLLEQQQAREAERQRQDLVRQQQFDATFQQTGNVPNGLKPVPDAEDDPFGFGTMPQTKELAASEDDDILGMLGRPVAEVKAREAVSTPRNEMLVSTTSPRDQALAELIDMGFPSEKATAALNKTPTRSDVQAAVGHLLRQAHEQAHEDKSKPNQRRGSTQGQPAWMRAGSPGKARMEDVGPKKHDIGSVLVKSANSLWTMGSKKINQAVADLTTDMDPTQPKWMRETADVRGRDGKQKTIPASKHVITNEAMLLETANEPKVMPERPQPRKPTFQEEETVYVSPARRKQRTKSSSASLAQSRAQMKPPEAVTNSTHSRPPAPLRQNVPIRPASLASPSKTQRQNPAIDPATLKRIVVQRQSAAAAFKRGDYSQASLHYASTAAIIPKEHTLILPVLADRALCHLKTGNPKACIVDADTMLGFVGEDRGRGEMVELGGTDGNDAMETYWGKAMMLKAEALEQLERWADAGESWRSCVEAGVGGATSIAGRNRAEAALRPKPPSKKKPMPRPPTVKSSAVAVSRLRAANAAADQADDEKFALADQVDARLKAWRSGKEGNLRALLSSLETVLWADCGWNKVGMGDVLLPGRVKVVYMRGISKVHPDKLPISATTEQKMISAAVFATLNEAWEKFKTENAL